MNTSDPFGLLTPFTAEDELAAAAWDAKEAARKARALARKANTYAILNSTIPQTGRLLTSAEVKSLRASRGYAPTRAYVVQAGATHRGYVYRPVSGGRVDTGIVVETK